MKNHILSHDTQATLLLCASFGYPRTMEPKPLTLREYNNLASWLENNDLTPQDLLDITIQDKLSQVVIKKLESHRILALLKRGAMLSFAVEKWTNQGLWILTRGDAKYPQYLKQKLKHQAPTIIYGVGNQELLFRGGLAIVGSRDIDDPGLKYTQKLAQLCAEQNIQVISGGARGVDQTSMLSTLAAGGTLVGVMADRLAKVAVAKQYRTAIQEGRLALISTYDPDAGFHIGNAMGRNKYMYALADHALVVNSQVNQGGTWAGATEALEKITDTPILVRIGQNDDEGNCKLIEKGAIPFPQPPWINPLKVLIADQLSNLKNHHESKIFIEQPSLLDENIVSGKSLQKDVNNVSQFKDINQSFAFNKKPSLISKKTNENNDKLLGNESSPQNIYEAVLPFILQSLDTPKNDKTLAESLDVQIGQMRIWLKRAVKEGKINKNKQPVTYEVNKVTNLSLDFFKKSGNSEQGIANREKR